MQIELPILFHTAETMQLSDAGLPEDDSKFAVRNDMFYTIDAVIPATDDNYAVCKHKCWINTGVEQYKCNMSYDSVIKKISQEKKRELIKCN